MSEWKETPLCSRHQTLGAKMVPFAGWLMPVSYSGIQQEHFAVRSAAGMFDASHMGLVRCHGDRALDFVQQVTVNDASKLAVGMAQYSAMCYPNGTCVDDIYVCRTGDQEYHIVINAGCKEKDMDWLRSHLISGVECSLLDTGIIAIQGPAAASIVTAIWGAAVVEIPKNGAKFVEFAQSRMLITRTGYTGEDGFEVFPHNDVLGLLFDECLRVGAPLGLVPAGLGCRDTLRLESGFSLYGHELSDSINLVEAGLSWIVGWDKPAFIGRDALLSLKKEGVSRKLVGLVAQDKAIPRDGMKIFKGDLEVGVVTSGGVSPGLGKGVALAYVNREYATLGTELEVDVRNQRKLFQVVARRFVGGK